MFAQQGKKDVVKLETCPSFMAELEDVKCCTSVHRSKNEIGIVARICVAVIITANFLCNRGCDAEDIVS